MNLRRREAPDRFGDNSRRQWIMKGDLPSGYGDWDDSMNTTRSQSWSEIG